MQGVAVLILIGIVLPCLVDGEEPFRQSPDGFMSRLHLITQASTSDGHSLTETIPSSTQSPNPNTIQPAIHHQHDGIQHSPNSVSSQNNKPAVPQPTFRPSSQPNTRIPHRLDFNPAWRSNRFTFQIHYRSPPVSPSTSKPPRSLLTMLQKRTRPRRRSTPSSYAKTSSRPQNLLTVTQGRLPSGRTLTPHSRTPGMHQLFVTLQVKHAHKMAEKSAIATEKDILINRVLHLLDNLPTVLPTTPKTTSQRHTRKIENKYRHPRSGRNNDDSDETNGENGDTSVHVASGQSSKDEHRDRLVNKHRNYDQSKDNDDHSHRRRHSNEVDDDDNDDVDDDKSDDNEEDDGDDHHHGNDDDEDDDENNDSRNKDGDVDDDSGNDGDDDDNKSASSSSSAYLAWYLKLRVTRMHLTSGMLSSLSQSQLSQLVAKIQEMMRQSRDYKTTTPKPTTSRRTRARARAELSKVCCPL